MLFSSFRFLFWSYSVICCLDAHEYEERGHGSKIHKCIHNELANDPPIKATNIPYYNHPYDKENKQRRELADDDSYEYIRITPYYDAIESVLSADDLSYVKSIVSGSIKYLESFIKVIPIDGTFYLPRYCTSWYSVFGFIDCIQYYQTCLRVSVPDDHYELGYLYDYDTLSATKLHGSGITDTDFVLYVSYGGTRCNATDSTVAAYAKPCVQDQYGRPIAGGINICQRTIESKYWKQDVLIALHEITHALVMTPTLWDDFIDDNGTTIPFEDVYFTKLLDSGYNQSYIITDKVKELAQSHYHCYDNDILPGLPLEDDGGAGSVGTHWEEHHVNTEYMGAYIYSAMMYVSEFTFALMEDSGWYQIDYNYAEPYYWGHGEECRWFTEDCINKTTETSNWPQYYCDATSDNGCSYDYAAVAWCLMSTSLDDIPDVFQYYSDSQQGGTAASEYCSFRDPGEWYQAGFEEVCWDTTPSPSPKPYDGVTFGLNSRCVDTKTASGYERGYCFEHECYDYDEDSGQWNGVYIIMSDSETINCNRNEYLTEKSSSDTNLTITCPDVDAICRNSEPFECYWGNYNDDLAECICSPGYNGTQCDNEDRGHVAGVELGSDSTPAPTTAEDYLCIEGVPSTISQVYQQWNTDEWMYDGIYNYYPSYVFNDTYSGITFYLYWNIFYHIWAITPTKGTITLYSYCLANEFTPDISDCNGNWLIYISGEWQSFPTIVSYFGLCDSTPLPTEFETTTTTTTTSTTTSVSSIKPTSIAPSNNPTYNPSDKPSHIPSMMPTDKPSDMPSNKPSSSPSYQPTVIPTLTTRLITSTIAMSTTDDNDDDEFESTTSTSTTTATTTTATTTATTATTTTTTSTTTTAATVPGTTSIAAITSTTLMTSPPTTTSPVPITSTVSTTLTNDDNASTTRGTSTITTIATTTENNGGGHTDTCSLEYCKNKPCSCNEVKDCRVCHDGQGCSQCKDGYFKKDENTQCVNCKEFFGDNCMHCADIHGCQQCKDGTFRLYDENCGLYYCSETDSSSSSSSSSNHGSPSDSDEITPTTTSPTTSSVTFESKYDFKCIENCENDKCDRESNQYCDTFGWDDYCTECKNGYFFNNRQSPCINCVEKFGNACLNCHNYAGCSECADGFIKKKDGNCGLNYCKKKEN